MNQDSTIFSLIEKENQRQRRGMELIASENYVSDQVMAAMGSCLTNKYAEGYPGKRYYGGCQVVDEVEQLAIDRICKLFDAEYANVQPHSGAQANAAVFLACLNPGDTFMGLNLDHGGHLSHGSLVNTSGIIYKPIGIAFNCIKTSLFTVFFHCTLLVCIIPQSVDSLSKSIYISADKLKTCSVFSYKFRYSANPCTNNRCSV